MPSGCRLFLDASGLTTRIGMWEEGRWRAYREDNAPALEGLFADTGAVLAEAKMDLSAIGGFIYVEGPGSVLGLRLAAMAIRTWQTSAPRPILACGSLHLAAALALAGGSKPPFAICTEARQGLWNLLEVHDTSSEKLVAAELRQVSDNALPGGPLFHLPARKAWTAPPPHAEPLPAALRNHPGVLNFPGLCRPAETAAPYGATPAYRKWEPSTAAS